MTTLPQSSQNQLRQFVEQIERLEVEKKGLGDDIAAKFAEAKAVGCDVKTLRKVLRLRRKSKTEREEEDSLLDVYLHALGMLDGTPMGDYLKREAEDASIRETSAAIDDVKRDAAERLSDMHREDGGNGDPLMSLNGGPLKPASEVIPGFVKSIGRSFDRGTRKGRANA